MNMRTCSLPWSKYDFQPLQQQSLCTYRFPGLNVKHRDHVTTAVAFSWPILVLVSVLIFFIVFPDKIFPEDAVPTSSPTTTAAAAAAAAAASAINTCALAVSANIVP
jgi:hypothetical protein